MKATPTREHKDQIEVTVITVTLPAGQKQAFVRGEKPGRVYADGGADFWSEDQFEAALQKMRAVGATVIESTGYIFGAA